ncbi:hypothetical protein QKU48_gp0079 [Fadolivirus algeromassiliense]|jgi:hypothetical protein|uniref:Uncharacterized protein n=1 Tax=Fadolivirus FV1/VV64 TaxID=3070911 RepID=A0A7D3V8I1_9VIRU|nr:hypothetical protein QKU48_gp0079 [Fadolivirus algeromassiliense]QKF93537.1 hypothetical protein Fadolivirus_1_79 [Fadolivirus FV1/VV64]
MEIEYYKATTYAFEKICLPEKENTTAKFYKLILSDDMKNAVIVFKNMTDEEIYLTSKNEHPILHELCSQVYHTFTLLQELWALQNLQKYWDNPNYQDKYGLTPLQRLSINMNCLPSDSVDWINENMNVKSVNDYHTKWGLIDKNKIQREYKYNLENKIKSQFTDVIKIDI